MFIVNIPGLENNYYQVPTKELRTSHLGIYPKKETAICSKTVTVKFFEKEHWT